MIGQPFPSTFALVVTKHVKERMAERFGFTDREYANEIVEGFVRNGRVLTTRILRKLFADASVSLATGTYVYSPSLDALFVTCPKRGAIVVVTVFPAKLREDMRQQMELEYAGGI